MTGGTQEREENTPEIEDAAQEIRGGILEIRGGIQATDGETTRASEGDTPVTGVIETQRIIKEVQRMCVETRMIDIIIGEMAERNMPAKQSEATTATIADTLTKNTRQGMAEMMKYDMLNELTL